MGDIAAVEYGSTGVLDSWQSVVNYLVEIPIL